MTVVLAVVITGWHLFLLRPAWLAARRQVPPRPVEFAIASFVVYYDVGLWLDALGIQYRAPGFLPLADAEPSVRFTAYTALVLVPAILLVAARQGRPKGLVWAMAPPRRLSIRQERQFFALFALFACLAIGLSTSALYVGGSVPGARLIISGWLGPGVVLLYLPLDLAAYYPLTANGRGRRGLAVSLLLSVVSSFGMLALGQRTLLLVPFFIVMVCRVRFRAATFAAAAGVTLVVVVALGLLFKPSGVAGSDHPSILATMNESMARAPVMAAAIERAETVGTSVMRYPGEGYVYATLFFVPRQLAPFKGQSSAQRLTDAIEGDDRFGRWAYGVGMIEEAVINVGLGLAPIVLAGLGWALGALEGIVTRRSALIAPVSGGALWLCGYHLPAILLLFGLMFVVMLVIDVLLSRSRPDGEASATDTSDEALRPGEGIES